MNKWRTLKVEELHNYVSQDNYDTIDTLISDLDKEFKELLVKINDDLHEIKNLDCLTSAGNFRDYILQKYGKPYMQWDHIEGYKSKYYRIIIEQARQAVLSLKDRINISEICEKYNYNIDNNKIIEELNDKNIPYTEGILRNICRTRNTPTFNTDVDFIFNCTAEDRNISTVDYKDNVLYFTIRVYNEWVSFNIQLPYYIRLVTTKFAKPIIQRNKDTGELYLRICYETPEMSMIISKKDKSGVLSCDLGKVKIFSAVITFDDGSYSSELIASKELERLNEKLAVLNKEKNILWKKICDNDNLLKGRDNKYLFNHREDQYKQRKLIINKIVLVKEHMSWVIARDIVMHAFKHGVNTLKLEDLKWLDSKGGKWSFGDIVQKIIEISDLYGITVLLVNAKNSSHTDPFLLLKNILILEATEQ